MNRLVFIKAETTKDGTRIYLLPLSTIKQINFTDSEAELSVWDRDMKEIKTTVGVTNDGTYISLGLDALRSIGDGIFALSLNLQLEGESQDYPDKEYFYIKLKHDDQHVILENVWTRDKPYNMFQEETNNNSDSKGRDGKSAYAIWLANEHNGTEIDFLNWLRGPQGEPGKDAIDTVKTITSGTLSSLSTGKYEIECMPPDTPIEEWGLCDVVVGQHYAKQVFTVTGATDGNQGNVYVRVRDYSGQWHEWRELT